MEACWYCGKDKKALKEITKESPSDAFGRGSTLRERYFVCKECYDARTGKPAQQSEPSKPQKPPILKDSARVVEQIL